MNYLHPILKQWENISSVGVKGITGSALAFTAWNLRKLLNRSVLLVVDGPRTLDIMHQDLSALAGREEKNLFFYPPWEVLPAPGMARNLDISGDRFQVLHHCLQKGKDHSIIVTCVHALMQHVPLPEDFAKSMLVLKRKKNTDLEALSLQLEKMGYEFVPEVESKGEAARRGGLLDVWPPDQAYPLRVEFFGTEIDSIRQFDPEDQCSIGKVNEFMVGPTLKNQQDSGSNRDQASLLDFFSESTVWLWHAFDQIRDHARKYEKSLHESGADETYIPWMVVRSCAEALHQSLHLFTCDQESTEDMTTLNIQPIEGVSGMPYEAQHHQLLEKERKKMIRRALSNHQSNTHIFFNTQGGLKRFEEQYLSNDQYKHVHLNPGPLSEGFSIPEDGLLFHSENDFYGFQKSMRGKYDPHTRKGPRHMGTRFSDWTDMEPGEFVVHLEHGIGRYLGLYEMVFRGRSQETLVVEYRDKAKLYIPITQAHLLSRYIGLAKSQPRLHRLGGTRWQREKSVAHQAIQDMAAKLIETQARRQTQPGHAFSEDTPLQGLFEATFPFQETPDQEAAIQTIKTQMENQRPMDHLVCGDVGYGKTEVAMRAAFKAVMDKKQVALLAPTTILAQQHFDTFVERMAPFPIALEMLSRFRSKGQQNRIIHELRKGKIDVVIGTHRLIQEDVSFKNLGLVMIDEEQRFGVAHKEKFKQRSGLVDVLTLTATPIPRTLYMSLTGAREMSVISTPPLERLPIKTIVQPYSDEIVRKAIDLELDRDGQVFYLHNRILSIERIRKRLKNLLPEVRIEIAHGRMSEKELEVVMRRFVHGDFDVLLCTTIIESGVDIPNVNTIIIDRADRFGMADLYQLRGRVGRDKHQAYAYLLLPEHGATAFVAKQRIQAMERYSSLGAGFKLALRDLETRGAGNLLGAKQSGHITAIGFDLYCQLLDRTIKQQKKKTIPPIIEVEVELDFVDFSLKAPVNEMSAVIPIEYVEDEKIRVDIYRRLSGAKKLSTLNALRREFKDRFGRIPLSLANLFRIAAIRIHAAHSGIKEVKVCRNKLMLKTARGYFMINNHFPRLSGKTSAQILDEIIEKIKNYTQES